MLRQKVSMLETESGQLAERLVRGQVSSSTYTSISSLELSVTDLMSVKDP